jgi:hypothetical protein
MAISKSHDKKSPSQNPVAFFKMEQQGGAYGKPTKVGDMLTGGPMNEKIMGRPNLGTTMTGNSPKSK